jgi:DNA-binding IscR family transcriptional regulator
MVERLCLRLKQHNLVAEVQGDRQGFILGRAAGGIRLEEVLTAFRATDLDMADGATAPALAALASDLEQARHDRIAEMTMADVLPGDDIGSGRFSARRREPSR